jgi:hypothetical protein
MIAMFRPVCCLCLLALSILAAPHLLLAQGGGRGARGAGRPTICVHDCNSRSNSSSSDDDTDKTSLRNFQQLLAVQATPEQNAAFAIVVQDTQAASAQLHKLRDSASQTPAKELAAQIPALDQALDKIHQGTHDFLASFTARQQSGLKEAAKKLERVDAELTVQRKALEESIQSANPEAIAKSAANIDAALDGVQSEQLTLGGEMSIGSTSEEQATNFDIPEVTASAKFAGQTVPIPTSGIASRVSSANGQRLLSLSLISDFSGLQENTASLLGASLNHAPRCGDRIQVEDAALTPVSPASVVVDVRLHVERWICPIEGGDAREIAADDATFDVKLTPSIINNGGVTLDAETVKVETEGALLHQDLASGDLGLALRRKITAFISSMVTQGVDLKTVLPPAAQAVATIQRAEFQDGGAGRITLVLDGQLQFSDAQAQQFAAQLAAATNATAPNLGASVPARTAEPEIPLKLVQAPADKN